jgi:hypothetical protein
VQRIEVLAVGAERLVANALLPVDRGRGDRGEQREIAGFADRVARIVPSQKFVTYAWRSSGETAAQQTSLRVLGTGPLTMLRRPGRSSRYDDAEAAPTCPPAASVTMRLPVEVNSNPYGVAPAEATMARAPALPSAAIANVVKLSVPRSLTTSVAPSGLNATCAGSASGALSSSRSPASGSSVPSAARRKPRTPVSSPVVST